MLNDQVVVITGGAGLIGQAFVRSVVEHGAIAIVADVNKQAGSDFVNRLKCDVPQSRSEFVALDITKKDSLKDMIAYLHDRYGRIDALVNNAYPRNKNYGRKFEEVTYDDFCQNVAMHVGGYFLASQQIAGYFKTQGYGSIINMASVYGVIARRFGV